MSKAIIDEQNLTDIADAIRAKNGSADTYTPAEMATAISNMPSPQTYDYLVSYETHDVVIDQALTLGDQYLPYLVTPYWDSDTNVFQIFVGLAENNTATGTQAFKGIVGGGGTGDNQAAFKTTPAGIRGTIGSTGNDQIRRLGSSYGMNCTAGTTVHLAIYKFKIFLNH